jgi:hypothetical protein
MRLIFAFIAVSLFIAKPSYAFDHGQPLQPPAPCVAHGYTSLKFDSEFSSPNIDLANTKVSGFQWYLSNHWPNSSPYTGSNWPTVPTISTSNISVSGGVLTINGDASGFGYGIATAVWNGSALVGATFGGGFCVEYKASFVAQTPGSGGVGTLWGVASEFLTGTASRFGEIDHIECTPISSGDVCSASMYIHDWNISGSTLVDTECSCGNTNQANPPISHSSLGNMQDYITLWVPAAQNGGTGLIRRYFNGSELTLTEQNYSATGQPNPAPGNQSPANGQFSEMDAQHFIVIIGADSTIPINVQYVRVWQLP